MDCTQRDVPKSTWMKASNTQVPTLVSVVSGWNEVIQRWLSDCTYSDVPNNTETKASNTQVPTFVSGVNGCNGVTQSQLNEST